jgi:hypothetical protein
MPTLRIDPLYHAAWKIFGFQYDQCVADRDRFVAKLQRRLGHEMAAQIQKHVDISLGRVLAIPDRRDPDIVTMKEFYELWGIEKNLIDIKRQIDANAVFFVNDGLLGLSWQQDVLRLVDGQVSPGFMPLKNIKKLLAMVRGAKQPVMGDDDDAAYFRRRRRELVQFLQRAVWVGEPLYCCV